MRGAVLVTCALVTCALLGGCKGAKPSPQAASDDAGAQAAIAPATGIENALEQPLDLGTPIFLPSGDGGVSPVVRDDAPNMRYARLGRDACLSELGRRGIAFEEAAPIAWAPRGRAPTARNEAPVGATKQSAGSRKKPSSKTKPSARTKRTSAAKRGASTKQKKLAKPAKAARPKAPPQTTTTSQADVAIDETQAQVLAPVRLRGPLRGISIHSGLPEKKRATSTIEIFDCRLVLALDDFAAVLAKHDVVEVVHMSAFRSLRDRGCTPKYVGKQHCGALAVDIGTFRKKDGSVLDVDKDFNGRIGTATCTAGTGPNPVTPAATELWDIVCESARRGLFHVMLTPNANTDHKNHFHLEITPDVKWMLIE